MNKIRSVGAVIAGFLTVVILAGITDTILTKTGAFPAKPEDYTSGLLLVALAYRTVFAVLAGVAVTKLAPNNPMRHVLILATIGALTGLAGVITGWNQVGYPHWYSITLTILTFPAIWYGGKLVVSKK